jgi:hypothetical protein
MCRLWRKVWPDTCPRKVIVRKKRNESGKLEIHFSSGEELDRLLEIDWVLGRFVLKFQDHRANFVGIYFIENYGTFSGVMDSIWEHCMDLLQTKVNQHTMSTWLKPIVCEKIHEDRIVLTVPNNFFIRWIKENHIDIIRDSLAEVTGRTIRDGFQIAG